MSLPQQTGCSRVCLGALVRAGKAHGPRFPPLPSSASDEGPLMPGAPPGLRRGQRSLPLRQCTCSGVQGHNFSTAAALSFHPLCTQCEHAAKRSQRQESGIRGSLPIVRNTLAAGAHPFTGPNFSLPAQAVSKAHQCAPTRSIAVLCPLSIKTTLALAPHLWDAGSSPASQHHRGRCSHALAHATGPAFRKTASPARIRERVQTP